MDDLNSISTRIKVFREAQGLSQSQLGAMLGVEKITVLRWENGTSKPSALAAARLQSLGIGVIVAQDTKDVSTPRLLLRPDNSRGLRQAIRTKIRIGPKSYGFEPSPYVINGPSDQLKFFEEIYALQERRRVDSLPEDYARRLSAVTCLNHSNIPTMQNLLESPKPAALAWNPNYGTHGWHRYVGRFPPHLIRALINSFGAKPGDVLLDPFCGSGTTLIEGRLLGLHTIGIEICPLSCLISRTKSQFPESAAIFHRLMMDLAAFYGPRWSEFSAKNYTHKDILQRKGNSIRAFANMEKWFIPEALLGASIIVEFALAQKGFARDAVCCALSACMRRIGNVDVDVVRAEYRKEPRTNVNVLALVERALGKMGGDVARSLESHRGAIASPAAVRIIEGSVLNSDVTIRREEVDFIITSPPYGVESLSYLRTHLLSYRCLAPILGHDPYSDDADFIGSEYLGKVDQPPTGASDRSKTFRAFFGSSLQVDIPDALRRRTTMMMKFFSDMERVARKFQGWLRPGGQLAFVIGNKRLGDRVIPTDQIIREIFCDVGLEFQRSIKHKLKCSNSNSEVPWQERIIQDEFILLFSRR